MSHLKYFGIKNFRVFDEEGYLFKFAPITIISGANNAGKSSVIKAITLLKESVATYPDFSILDLNNQSHHLGDFSNILQVPGKPLKLSFPFPFLYQENFILELSYISSTEGRDFRPKLKEVAILDEKDGSKLIEIKYKNLEDEDPDYVHLIRKDVGIFINHSLLRKYFEDLIPTWDKHAMLLEDYNSVDKSLSEYTMTRHFKRLELNKALGDVYKCQKKWELYEKKEYYPFDKESYGLIKKILQENIPNQITEDWIGYEDEMGGVYEDLLLDLDHPIGFIKSWIRVKASKEYGDLIKGEFQRILGGLDINKSISQLPSTRGVTSRLYSTESTNGFNVLVRDFVSLGLHNRSHYLNFINEGLKLCGIGELYKILILPLPDYDLNQVKLTKIGAPKGEDSKFLVDFGYGTLQLVAILMKICVEAGKHIIDEKEDGAYRDHVLILDEPEANLHPDWQSKLADIFVLAAKRFNTQFIIETHSEYLIRKLQYLVAKSKISHLDAKIYYINNIDSSKPEKVETINFEPNGNIDFSKFGEGFFDVSLDLITSLWDAQISKTLSEEEKQLLKDLGKAHKDVIALHEKLAKIQAEEGNQTEESLKELKEGFSSIKSDTNSLKGDTKKMLGQLDQLDENIVEILKSLASIDKGLQAQKKSLDLLELGEDKRFEMLYSFFDDYWMDKASDIHDYHKYIEHWLPNWEKLDERSLTFLIGAEFAYKSLKKYQAEDYSPAILQYCRILEREFAVKIFNKLRIRLIEKYWESKSVNDYEQLFLDIENQLNVSPPPANEDILKRLNNLAKVLKNDSTQAVDVAKSTEKSVMLGQAIDAFFLIKEPSIVSESIIVELKDILMSSFDWGSIASFSIPPAIQKSVFSGRTNVTFEECLITLKDDFRNKASHTGIIGASEAVNCKELVEIVLQFWIGLHV